MKFSITRYHAVACWQWDTSSEPHKLYRYGKAGAANPNAISAFDDDDDDDDEEVCGICQLAFEACCPECKVPGDDCPLIWGQCSHTFHLHCLLKWLETESSKGQCPLDRRPWATQDRGAVPAPDNAATHRIADLTSRSDLTNASGDRDEEGEEGDEEENGGEDEDEEMADDNTTETEDLDSSRTEGLHDRSLPLDPIRM